MRKILFIFIILVCMTGCAERSTKVTPQPDLELIEEEEPIEDTTDWIAVYQKEYNTDYVYQDAFSSVNYLAITEDEVIFITRAAAASITKSIKINNIAAVEITSILSYNKITITLIGSPSNQYIFTTDKDPTIITDLIK